MFTLVVGENDEQRRKFMQTFLVNAEIKEFRYVDQRDRATIASKILGYEVSFRSYTTINRGPQLDSIDRLLADMQSRRDVIVTDCTLDVLHPSAVQRAFNELREQSISHGIRFVIGTNSPSVISLCGSKSEPDHYLSHDDVYVVNEGDGDRLTQIRSVDWRVIKQNTEAVIALTVADVLAEDWEAYRPGMSLAAILSYRKSGKAISRLAWATDGHGDRYMHPDHDGVLYVVIDGVERIWGRPSLVDFAASDWTVYEPQDA